MHVVCLFNAHTKDSRFDDFYRISEDFYATNMLVGVSNQTTVDTVFRKILKETACAFVGWTIVVAV